MKILKSEIHEELSAEWQYQLILLLKQTLSKNKISDKVAKEIIGDFAFDFSMLHDQGEIKFNNNSYNPKICFDDFDRQLQINKEETTLHDYAFGNTSEAFGE